MATLEQIDGLKKLTKGLKTVTNYAKKRKVTRRTIYNMSYDKRLSTIEIDGVLFVIP